MYYDKSKKKSGFPDPLSPKEVKETEGYGLKFAKAIIDQWGDMNKAQSLLQRRQRIFLRNRRYANGTQDTSIYRQLLTSLDPNNGDGSFLNLDFTPVPILPKFVRIVVNKILSKKPYPNLEAIDPLSSSQKDLHRRKMEMQVAIKDKMRQVADKLDISKKKVSSIPDTIEEAEIFLANNIKSSVEIAAQIATNMTLEWNDFSETTFRRCVNDLAAIGMAVAKRSNDPNYGIVEEYVDPAKFVHSYTEDPNFADLIYAGHIKSITISELRRIMGGQMPEDKIKEIAAKAQKRYGYELAMLNESEYDDYLKRYKYGYDEFMVEVLDFEFKSVDCMYFESKESKYGNTGFYFKGSAYKEPANSVFKREVSKIENEVVYGGCYVIGCDTVFNYGLKTNIPKNIHDLTRANLSYSVVATNFMDMIPKSMVDSCIGFADQLQLTHLKLQQAIAKAKPDGIVIDIEALENVQLGKGGELQPLELHDIYEQTGVFYYRSKNPEGGFQNPPIREIGNSIRNMNEMIGIYNHYLRLIRDATGINEAMDASTPKGDALVGVQQMAIAAGNNAIYDITNASMMLFKKVSSDIVKCLQVLPKDSIIYKAYANAIGNENMEMLSSFADLPMYNFGVTVQKEMDDAERQYLEQNIQISLSQKEIDIEDAISIRQLRDVNQAERLLVIRRKKRMKMKQDVAMQNSQMQAQMQADAANQASQARVQEMSADAEIQGRLLQLKHQLNIERMTIEHEMLKELEEIKSAATIGFKEYDKDFREKLEVMKEDRKDERVDKQAVKQSQLLSQRKDLRGELEDATDEGSIDQVINQIMDK